MLETHSGVLQVPVVLRGCLVYAENRGIQKGLEHTCVF